MKNSVFGRSMYFTIISSFFVLLLFAFAEVNTIRNFNDQIEKIYTDSLNYSCNYWADQFYVTNKKLKSMVNKNDNTDFNMISRNDDISINCTNLQRELTNLSIINDNRIVFFAYFPDKNIFMSSVAYVNYFTEKENDELMQYLEEKKPKNSSEWKNIKLGNNFYFLHTYRKDNNYSGCYISCENVLSDIIPQERGSDACILNMDGSVFFGHNVDVNASNCFVYARAIRMINKKICVVIPYGRFISSGRYVIAILLVAIITSMVLIGIVLLHQERTIFNPLKKLKGAMESFSEGNTQIVLPEHSENNEIAVLYRTFNHMEKQIVKLNHDINKASVEKERMYSQFLQVQIQPHFYTNILSLIYTLANAHMDEPIQELAQYMSDYFRYLLSLKDDYVYLEAELNCVEKYALVQQIRYQERFDLKISCTVNTSKEKIPPLIIQTFIENSIKHNIMMVEDLRIYVQIQYDHNNICIKIQDNGLGFPQNILKSINEGKNLSEDGEHIGIANVKNRLEYLYVGSAVMNVSNAEKGAVICIIVPRINEGDNVE